MGMEEQDGETEDEVQYVEEEWEKKIWVWDGGGSRGIVIWIKRDHIP
jgi:hypothetical protein